LYDHGGKAGEATTVRTFADLYAGAGLFSHGFRSAGFEPSLALELSKEAAASYRRNVAECVEAASVSEVRSLGRVDALIAGPPCQGFSTLGRRDPLDVRNDLCLAVLPWVDAAAPRVVVIENVPPFVRSGHWQVLSRGLRDRGYEVAVWDLDAADFGVPQIRRRAFTVASAIGPIAPPAGGGPRVACRAALIDRPIDAADPMHYWPTAVGVARERIRLVPERGDKRDVLRLAPGLCPPSWARIGCQATDAWGRMDPDAPANTLRCTFQNPSKGRYLHPTADRVISLREGARLQGVPDHWTFVGRPYPVARQIGNGVPIPLAAAVGRAVYAAFDAVDGAIAGTSSRALALAA
jgi:DNA (cytosine-5)-methyltransferase 1